MLKYNSTNNNDTIIIKSNNKQNNKIWLEDEIEEMIKMENDDIILENKNICECHFDSHYAFVIDKIGDKPIKYMSIFDYLKSKSWRNKIKQNLGPRH